MTSPTKPILVIGSTGKTGSRIAAGLRARGLTVRDGSRSAPIPFDWDDQNTWAPALDGVHSAYVSYFPDLAIPGAAEKIAELAALAKQLGTGRLVLLSGRGETHAEACEEIIRNSGVDFTLLRCGWFMQNFSEGYLVDPVMAGVIALPAGRVQEPMVDVDDIAEVAIAALTEARHSGQLYEITGPELLDFHQVAATLAQVTGRPVTYQPITIDDFRAGMTEIAGAFIADVITHVAEESLDGRNAWLGDGVQRALGRAPRSFADFCARAARAGAWREAA